MCAFSMGTLEIYAQLCSSLLPEPFPPNLRERKKERNGKPKRINKIREFTNQFNVLNAAESEFEFEFEFK